MRTSVSSDCSPINPVTYRCPKATCGTFEIFRSLPQTSRNQDFSLCFLKRTIQVPYSSKWMSLLVFFFSQYLQQKLQKQKTEACIQTPGSE